MHSMQRDKYPALQSIKISIIGSGTQPCHVVVDAIILCPQLIHLQYLLPTSQLCHTPVVRMLLPYTPLLMILQISFGGPVAAVDGWWPTDTSPGGSLRKWKWRKWNKLERKRWRVKSQSVGAEDLIYCVAFGWATATAMTKVLVVKVQFNLWAVFNLY